jgi:hypothetical protein
MDKKTNAEAFGTKRMCFFAIFSTSSKHYPIGLIASKDMAQGRHSTYFFAAILRHMPEGFKYKKGSNFLNRIRVQN